MENKINPWNVVKLLHEIYCREPYGSETSVNAHEVELMEHIRGK